jgi:hypothetical protein
MDLQKVCCQRHQPFQRRRTRDQRRRHQNRRLVRYQKGDYYQRRRHLRQQT